MAQISVKRWLILLILILVLLLTINIYVRLLNTMSHVKFIKIWNLNFIRWLNTTIFELRTITRFLLRFTSIIITIWLTLTTLRNRMVILRYCILALVLFLVLVSFFLFINHFNQTILFNSMWLPLTIESEAVDAFPLARGVYIFRMHLSWRLFGLLTRTSTVKNLIDLLRILMNIFEILLIAVELSIDFKCFFLLFNYLCLFCYPYLELALFQLECSRGNFVRVELLL